MIDKHSDNWKHLPLWLKWCFSLNFLVAQPARRIARRIVIASHISGFLFCVLGLVSEASLAGGVIILSNASLFHLLTWQGDKLGIWYDTPEAVVP